MKGVPDTMARNETKGTKQLATTVDAALFDEFKAWVEGRGEKVRAHVEMAIRRHMDAPPPPFKPEAPPLPPVGGEKPKPRKVK
jgi:hypothetical protein